MGKKEKIFPINTVGGRIQYRRHELKLSRSKLYDIVYKISEKGGNAGSDSSKDRAVLNWESGFTELNYETLPAICKALQCSSDYLLGLDECTNKTYQYIHDKTGISESAIKILIDWNETANLPGIKYSWARNAKKAISDLIEQDIWLYKDVLNPIAEYCYYRNLYDNPNIKNKQRTLAQEKFRLALFTATNGLTDCIKAIYKNTKTPDTN